MDVLLILVIVAVVVGGVSVWRHSRPLFVLAIQEDGDVRTLKGSPPPRYPYACEDVARLHGLRSGRIRGVRRAGSVTLRFSDDIPEPARQALRNIWEPPPPPRGGSRAAQG